MTDHDLIIKELFQNFGEFSKMSRNLILFSLRDLISISCILESRLRVILLMYSLLIVIWLKINKRLPLAFILNIVNGYKTNYVQCVNKKI